LYGIDARETIGRGKRSPKQRASERRMRREALHGQMQHRKWCQVQLWTERKKKTEIYVYLISNWHKRKLNYKHTC